MKNTNFTPARANGTPRTGNGAPLANMPANNNGTFPVRTGAGQNSKFGSGVNSGPGQGGSVAKTGQKANMPAKNKSTTALPLGTTKHSVGGVPGYLRGK